MRFSSQATGTTLLSPAQAGRASVSSAMAPVRRRSFVPHFHFNVYLESRWNENDSVFSFNIRIIVLPRQARDKQTLGGKLSAVCTDAGRGESETGNQSALCGSESFVENSCITRGTCSGEYYAYSTMSLSESFNLTLLLDLFMTLFVCLWSRYRKRLPHAVLAQCGGAAAALRHQSLRRQHAHSAEPVRATSRPCFSAV